MSTVRYKGRGTTPVTRASRTKCHALAGLPLHGRKPRRRIALAATAHYLLRCLHAIRVRNPPWREPA